MKCPHCLVEINPDYYESFLGLDSIGFASIFKMCCPNPCCGKFILKLVRSNYKGSNASISQDHIVDENIIYPLVALRPKAPIQVDKHIAKDFNEACLVLSFSPKASAALSRRCLQNILREKAGVTHGNLIKEIEQVINNGKTPSYITDSVDAIRNVGNFAAHPAKDKVSGEIIDVDPGEAEWLLDVLELLFDFYYVQPEIAKKKRVELDAKLATIGKPPMK